MEHRGCVCLVSGADATLQFFTAKRRKSAGGKIVAFEAFAKMIEQGDAAQVGAFRNPFVAMEGNIRMVVAVDRVVGSKIGLGF